jgi:probable F420-dependent oxidoreductase
MGPINSWIYEAQMAHPRAFRFGVTAPRNASGEDWRTFCRKVEDLGFATLVMPDHLGDQFAPTVALASAFEVSSTLRMGVLVTCNDFRHPVVHAKELATLDVLSAGRIEWGAGAGWLAPEYEMAGIPFDRPAVRVDRTREAVAVMKRLFRDGPVTFEGEYYSIKRLEGQPKPIQRPHPPLLVGGAGKRMLTFAAREADIIGIAPSPTARAVGARPPLETVQAAVDSQVRWIKEVSGDRFGSIEINMVASPAIVTGDRETRAAKLADRLGLAPAEVLVSPHVWLGSVEQICDSLAERRQRWGTSYWAVPATAVDAVAPVVDRLAGT